MNKTQTIILVYALGLLCINTGFQSTTKKETPSINAWGSVDNENAENITISGLYEDIPVYEKPLQPETAPTANVAHVRFDDIKRIQNKRGKEGISKYQNREYIEIEIEFKNGKTHSYLVERARKIYYDIPFSDPNIKSLEKEVLFEAIREMGIKGIKQRPRDGQTKGLEQEKSPARDALCTQVQESIKDLEKNTKDEQKTNVINKIKEAINYLCA